MHVSFPVSHHPVPHVDTSSMYQYIFYFRRGQGVAINGEKVLKYCERALILARGDDEVYDIYRSTFFSTYFVTKKSLYIALSSLVT